MSALLDQHTAHLARLRRLGAIVATENKALTPSAEHIAQPTHGDSPAPIQRDWLYVAMPPNIGNLILRIVCAYFQISLEMLRSSRRTAAVMRPRQVAMYLMRKHTTLSTNRIGRLLGNRDHTCAIHAEKKIEKMRAADVLFDAELNKLETMIHI